MATKSIAIHIRLSRELNAALLKAAKKQDKTKAELIRDLLRKGVVGL